MRGEKTFIPNQDVKLLGVLFTAHSSSVYLTDNFCCYMYIWNVYDTNHKILHNPRH